MAQITLKHLAVAPLTNETDGSAPTYGNGLIAGNLMQANINWNRGNTRLDGDDKMVLRDNSPTSGTLTIGTTYLSRAAKLMMLNMEQDSAGSGSQTEYGVTGDPAPFVGVGYVWKDALDTETPFKAYWYYKVQFSLNEEMNTHGENTEYGTPSLEGEVMIVRPAADLHTRMRKEADCATEAAAIAWVDALANI